MGNSDNETDTNCTTYNIQVPSLGFIIFMIIILCLAVSFNYLVTFRVGGPFFQNLRPTENYSSINNNENYIHN